MTSPKELVSEFATKAYDTYALRNTRFTIIEELTIDTPLREIEEINEKFMKKYTFYLIGIDTGMIQKDLKLKKNELINFMLSIPKNTQKLTGITASVDLNQNVKFVSQQTSTPISSISQAMGANIPTPTQSMPITQPEQPQENQIDKMIALFVEKIDLSNSLGQPVSIHDLMTIAQSVMPGNALDLISTTKTKGLITEKKGVYTVVKV